jgi:pimeloyl-ACP methyl ester carboxylesterase
MKLSIISSSLASIALSLLPSINAQSSLPALKQSTTCTGTCQELVPLGIEFEHDSHAHTPRDDFYSIPTNFTSSMKPGILLRVETHTNLANYTVPSSLTMSRIMYTSKSLNGTVVPVSAFVLWPYAPFEYTKNSKASTPTKFPLVAWAHGTSGQFVDCAPSNYRSLQYHFMTSYSIAMEGFAVVATDYAGLGVTTLPNGEQSHAWLAGPAGANDVAYAIEAVRKAFPAQLETDGSFVTMGHSQGGNVAWAFAERQAKSPVPGYLGTISISPPTRIVELVNSALNLLATTSITSLPVWPPVVATLQPNIIASITAVYPAYNFSGMTPLSYDRWNNVLKPLQGCTPTSGRAFADVPLAQLAHPGWTNNTYVQQWQDAVAVSGKKFQGPLLIIAGDEDVIPVTDGGVLQESVSASCKASHDQSLEVVTYAAMQHFPVIQASRMKWMNWIKARFNENTNSNKKVTVCGKQSEVQGFNSNYTVQGTTPNWLVDWVTPLEGWKLAL